jgi:hypothetical protein
MGKHTNKYASKYTNEYGEEWVFEYNPFTRTGTLRGSDVDWLPYPVVEGHALGLLLNEGEIRWLRRAWAEASASEPP